MNQFNLYSGHFIFIDYYVLLKDGGYDEPIRNLRVKMQEYGNSDIAKDISREFWEEDAQGRKTRKYDATIQVPTIPNVIPKNGDKVIVIEENIEYIVKDIGYGWDSITMLERLQFSNKRTYPSVLYLGDRR